MQQFILTLLISANLATSGDVTSSALIPLVSEVDNIINSATASFDGLQLASAPPAAPTAGLTNLLQTILSVSFATSRKALH